MPYEVFWKLNPKKLESFYTAYKRKRELEDEKMWLYCGVYVKSAFETVIAHFGAGLSGKKSNAKYIEMPITKQAEENNRELTEEEKRVQTEKLFARLQIMEANFNLTHRKEEQNAND